MRRVARIMSTIRWIENVMPKSLKRKSNEVCVLPHVPEFTQLTFQRPWIYQLMTIVRQNSNLGPGPEASGIRLLAQCLSGPAAPCSPEPGE